MCEITEHWNKWSKTRHDLFGFIDILAVREDVIIGVQTTTADHVSHRINKIVNERAGELERLRGHFVLQVHGWRKKGNRWQPRIIILNTSVDMGENLIYPSGKYIRYINEGLSNE